MPCPAAPEELLSAHAEYERTTMLFLHGDRVVNANKAARQLLGLSAEELLVPCQAGTLVDAETARLDRDYFAHPSRATWVGYVNRFDGKRVDVEFRAICLDASRQLFCLEIQPLIRSVHEQELADSVEGVPVGMVMVDPRGRIVLVNVEIERLFQYERSELLGQPVEILLPKAMREHHEKMREGFVAEPMRRSGGGRQLLACRKDGTEFPVEVGLNPIHSEHGTSVVVAITDITARLQMQENFRLVVQNAPCGMVLLDEGQTILMINRRAEQLFEYAEHELAGHAFATLLAPGPGGAGATLPSVGNGIELTGLRQSGQTFPLEAGLSQLEFGRDKMVLVTIEDVSARKQLESSLRHFSMHDSLTCLPNRALFFERLEQAALAGQRYSLPFAVLMMDLDGFKEVNDTLGHEAGDEVLLAVANRLRRVVRKSDTIARLGGDEFAALLPGIGTHKSAAALAEKIGTAIRQPVIFSEHKVDIGISIGIAMFPEDGGDCRTLLAGADQAMYMHKRSRRKPRNMRYNALLA